MINVMGLNVPNKNKAPLSTMEAVLTAHPEYKLEKAWKSKYFYDDMMTNEPSCVGADKVLYRCGICMSDLSATCVKDHND
jgi:hypothetical protein